jgi:uncharacterized protein YecT (DUF1311 family)
MRRLNWTTIALIGGLAVLLLLIAYFAGTRNPDQDKLSDVQLTQPGVSATEKLCASKRTYELIKRDLFRRAGQLRGSDQAAYSRLAGFAVVRMDNPVMESEDQGTGAVNCSGTLSLDLPPGVAVAGGRRTLMSEIDYTVQPAADGSGQVVLLRSADVIIAPLATLARIAQPAPQTPPESNEVAPEQPEANVAASESANVQPGPPSAYPGRPSFDCSQARTRSEIAVCQDSGLSSLDLNTATQYRRALTAASPAQRQLLQSTRNRFLAFRDRCRDTQCLAEAYLGRMREIRDIMEGRWQSPR